MMLITPIISMSITVTRMIIIIKVITIKIKNDDDDDDYYDKKDNDDGQTPFQDPPAWQNHTVIKYAWNSDFHSAVITFSNDSHMFRVVNIFIM
jgi:hypothetical protein